MKKEIFKEMVLDRLLVASNNGDTVNSSGTQLVGHRPDIAPKAFSHAIYKGLGEKQLDELESALGLKLNPMLKSFYANANGMMIYSGSLRILGYVPSEATDRGVYDYPSSILTPNVSARIDGLLEGDIIVGWYKNDGSYVVVDKSGEVSRYDVNGTGEEIQRWVDFDNWLASEVIALHESYAY